MLLKRLFTKLYIKSLSNDKYIKYLRKQGVKIGNNCDIDKSAYFGSEPYLITIGNNVRITRGCQFITHDGGLWTLRKMGIVKDNEVKYGSITIGDNCNLSWNCTIMPNVSIGHNCVVAANAVVTKNIENNSVVGGVPAKYIESIFEYGEKVVGKTLPYNYLSQKEKKKFLTENEKKEINI